MPIPEISYVLVTSWYGFTCGNLIPQDASWVMQQNGRIAVSGAGIASLRTRRTARGSAARRMDVAASRPGAARCHIHPAGKPARASRGGRGGTGGRGGRGGGRGGRGEGGASPGTSVLAVVVVGVVLL